MWSFRTKARHVRLEKPRGVVTMRLLITVLWSSAIGFDYNIDTI